MAMTVLGERIRYLHVPKTGGTWTRTALLAGCPRAVPFVLENSTHARWFEVPRREFTLGFVWDPLSWWRSFWRFHKGPARRYVVSEQVCRECWSEDFDEFLRNVVARLPGHYGAVIDNYLGPIDAHACDMIGRQERLVDDLLVALERAGEPHDAAAIRAVPRTNVADPGIAAECTPATRDALLAAEAAMMRRFGYDGRPAADPAARGLTPVC